MILTYRYRIKDRRAAKALSDYARAVNFVWNYCCEIQRKAESNWKAGRKSSWPTGFQLMNLTAGTSRELGVHADTIGLVCRQFARSRDKLRHCPRFRSSGGARRALGWVPYRAQSVQVSGDTVTYRGRKLRLWLSRPIEGEIRQGAFVQDARGRWYATFDCAIADTRPTGAGELGIDLGLKAVATCSNGDVIPALQHYRKYEAALATAQRAKNKRRARAIHAKIANVRRDQLHKATTKIAAQNRLIVVGDVSSTTLAKTKMAKSIYDASWAILRNQLQYKASRHGAKFVEVDERLTSRTCSCCGCVPDSSPKGIGAVRIRAWTCSDCGARLDRDVNAARNILRLGLKCQPPVAEIAVSLGH